MAIVDYEAAVEFASNKLGIEDVPRKLQTNRLNLLNEMMKVFHERIPFTNFYMLSTSWREREVPNEEQMKQAILKKSGGICIESNGFFKMILLALGYNAIAVRTKIYISKIDDPHLSIVVSNVEKEGDLYYVEVGMGYPMFHAIPLHDDHLPNAYKFAFHWIKIEKQGDVYIRSHKKSTTFGEMTGEDNDEWVPFSQFDNTPKDFSFFHKSMELIYKDVSVSVLLNLVYASIYPPGKAVTLRDLTLRVWDETTNEIQKTEFENADEALNVVSSCFPMLEKEAIRRGFAYWTEARRLKALSKLQEQAQEKPT